MFKNEEESNPTHTVMHQLKVNDKIIKQIVLSDFGVDEYSFNVIKDKESGKYFLFINSIVGFLSFEIKPEDSISIKVEHE